MRSLSLIFLAFAFLPPPPAKIVFPTKEGPVTFDHAAHAKRGKKGCKTCHDALWPRSTKEPLKSSDGCKTCHRPEGQAFDTKGNCDRCHAPAKS